MGRRMVEVSREVIEQMFQEGHEAHYRITKGLPGGATLQYVALRRDTVYLEFEHPDWPESSEHLHIQVQQLRVSGMPQMPGPQEFA